MIDTHCHIIPKFEYNNSTEIITNAVNAGVKKMICIGCDFEDIDQTIELSKLYPGVVYAAIALHPEVIKVDTNVDEIWNDFLIKLEKYKDEIFAIGECGLDYYYSQDKTIHEKQQDLFKRHIEYSIEINKPLIIHTREAWQDTFDILDSCNVVNKKTSHHIINDEDEFPNMDIDLTTGIVHSFTGGVDEAKECIKRNFKIGINGIVTFKNKNLDSLRDAVKFAGKENIVFETDSPFLSPEPYRGKTNEPARIKDIVEYVETLLEEK